MEGEIQNTSVYVKYVERELERERERERERVR